MTTAGRLFRMFRTLALVAAFCGGCSLGTQAQNPTQAQEPQEIDVIRTSTSLVTVPVSVMDRQGRFVPDLSQGQFQSCYLQVLDE